MKKYMNYLLANKNIINWPVIIIFQNVYDFERKFIYMRCSFYLIAKAI